MKDTRTLKHALYDEMKDTRTLKHALYDEMKAALACRVAITRGAA
jgi:hypothetical protein